MKLPFLRPRGRQSPAPSLLMTGHAFAGLDLGRLYLLSARHRRVEELIRDLSMRGTSLFRRAAKYLPGRLRPGVILMYHRVNTTTADPWGMCVSPQNFRAHLQVLKRYSCVSLEKILAETRVLRNAVAITFDDGYADNLYNAIPALEAVDIPSTFFITTGGIGEPREFWWDELEYLVLNAPAYSTITFAAGPSMYSWNLATGESVGPTDAPPPLWPATNDLKLHLYRSIHRVLQAMREEDRSQAMRKIAEQSGSAPPFRQSYRRLNWDELITLSRHRLAEIGAHTVTHAKLSACERDCQFFEIRQSKIDIEGHVGRRLTSFAYPYGGPEHLNSTSRELVREAGFLRGCTTRRAAISQRDDCFSLPRVYVPDLPGDHFEKFLVSAFNS